MSMPNAVLTIRGVALYTRISGLKGVRGMGPTTLHCPIVFARSRHNSLQSSKYSAP